MRVPVNAYRFVREDAASGGVHRDKVHRDAFFAVLVGVAILVLLQELLQGADGVVHVHTVRVPINGQRSGTLGQGTCKEMQGHASRCKAMLIFSVAATSCSCPSPLDPVNYHKTT